MGSTRVMAELGARMTELGARTVDGVDLALTRVAVRGTRRAVCLVTHAMAASGRYLLAGAGGGFAGTLARAGMEVYVLDWRGHGQSRPRLSRAYAGWCFDDFVERDLPAAVDAVCASAGIGAHELVYAGHSLGGLAGLAAVATQVIPAPRVLGLWASSVWLPGPHGSWPRRALLELYALSSRPLGMAPVRLFGLGSADEPRGYVEQMARWARTGRWTSRHGQDYLAALDHIDIPVWAACGDDDRLCTHADAEVLRSRIRAAAPLRRVGQAAGDALDADHFSLMMHPALAPVWREFAGFAMRADRRE